MWTLIDRTDQHHHSRACCSPQKAVALVQQLITLLTLITAELR